jgi:hypothetical protein
MLVIVSSRARRVPRICGDTHLDASDGTLLDELSGLGVLDGEPMRCGERASGREPNADCRLMTDD